VPIDIRWKGHDSYTARVSPPDSARTWATPEPMTAKNLADKLQDLGCHTTDIADAFVSANPNWLDSVSVAPETAVAGDQVLVGLIESFVSGEMDALSLERRYLRLYKDTSIEGARLKEPLERAFLAIEAYDPAMTRETETETVHNSSYETLVTELTSIRDDLRLLTR
jgi:hypothetical protein